MIQTFPSQRINSETFRLAEGPVWIAARNAFCFVDIEGMAVCEWRPEQPADMRRIPAPDLVGFLVPIDARRVLAGVRDTLMILDLESGSFEPYLRLNLDPGLRFNDGKCGPDGTLYAGVMAIDQADPQADGRGALFVIRAGAVRQTLPGMTIPNGIAWSPDQATLYHTDTPTQTVFAYDINDDATLANRRVAFIISKTLGAPDGFCADDGGYLWIALWGGRKVRRFDPRDGSISAEIQVAGLNVSCPAFGGKERDWMMITSGSSEIEDGAIFGVKIPFRGPEPFPFRFVP